MAKERENETSEKTNYFNILGPALRELKRLMTGILNTVIAGLIEDHS